MSGCVRRSASCSAQLPHELTSRPNAAALLKCNARRLSNSNCLDRYITRIFNRCDSGVPFTLIGREGIRCVSPFKGGAMPKLRPQLSAASSSLRCHWALRCEVWEGGEEL